MRTIYLDSEFHCYVTDNGALRAVQTGCFDGRCDAFIEGYRFVPEGESWTREDGAIFVGEMITPWKNYDELNNAQQEYENQLLNEYTKALEIMGVVL